MEATTSPILAGNILNESIPKDEADQLLQDLFHEMNEEGLDEIRFAAYRTAAKLLFVQNKTNLHLVDVFNMIEAFRENGLNTLDHNTELHETRLEAIVSSIFYALNKRLPTTHYIDVERSISLVTNWLLYAYDSDAIGRIRVLSVKTALSTLCAGRLVDKLRYHFSQIEDDNRLLNFPKFEAYLRKFLQLPAAVGEAPTFGFAEEMANKFFKPSGHPATNQAVRIEMVLKRTCQKLWSQEEISFGKEQFELSASMNEESAQILKDKGNKKFKLGHYDEAVTLYTEALKCVPQGTSKPGKDGKWMVLPAVLYSNRAQCHLNNSDWQSALSDCNEAMARCLQENEEAEKILVKTVFRRFKAHMELGHHLRALNDVSFCLRKSATVNNMIVNYWEALEKYRKACGLEPIRRCGNCIGGDGIKLKRCANCEEVYCSRECQLFAWEAGHKNMCNK